MTQLVDFLWIDVEMYACVCVILTSDTDNGFLAGHIGDVDEGVIERGEDAVGREVRVKVARWLVLIPFESDAPSARRSYHFCRVYHHSCSKCSTSFCNQMVFCVPCSSICEVVVNHAVSGPSYQVSALLAKLSVE